MAGPELPDFSPDLRVARPIAAQPGWKLHRPPFGPPEGGMNEPDAGAGLGLSCLGFRVSRVDFF
jgi:hypothetical protein